METKLRILVLTSSTGGGHDARAQAFAEWCFELYRHDVDVRIEQMLEASSVVNRSGVNLYNWIQLQMPALHNLFYAVVEGLSYLNRSTVSFGRSYYRDVLLEYRPHLILSVHDCLNRGYFPYARELLGPDKVKCVTYCGEFSGGWGYSRNWIEPSVDLYVSRTATARDFALKHGIPKSHTSVRGHLMRPRELLGVIPPEKRGHYLKKILGLKKDRFTIFLATGGNGANNHIVLLTALRRHASRIQVIAVCGRNKPAYNELVHWRSNHPEMRLFIEGYSEVVHELLQVSDVVVTRGGTTTCAKALHFECPIIFNAFGGIMPQEKLTWKFFRNGAKVSKVESASDFETLLDEWMGDPGAYLAYRQRFMALRYVDDQTELIDDLVALAESVADVKATRHPFPPRPGGEGKGSESTNGAAI